MISLQNLIHKYNLKSEATSNLRIQKVFPSLSLTYVKISLRDSPFSSIIEIANLHPTKGTPCAAYKNENYNASCGCSTPENLFKFTVKRNGYGLHF